MIYFLLFACAAARMTTMEFDQRTATQWHPKSSWDVLPRSGDDVLVHANGVSANAACAVVVVHQTTPRYKSINVKRSGTVPCVYIDVKPGAILQADHIILEDGAELWVDGFVHAKTVNVYAQAVLGGTGEVRFTAEIKMKGRLMPGRWTSCVACPYPKIANSYDQLVLKGPRTVMHSGSHLFMRVERSSADRVQLGTQVVDLGLATISLYRHALSSVPANTIGFGALQGEKSRLRITVFSYRTSGMAVPSSWQCCGTPRELDGPNTPNVAFSVFQPVPGTPCVSGSGISVLLPGGTCGTVNTLPIPTVEPAGGQRTKKTTSPTKKFLGTGETAKPSPPSVGLEPSAVQVASVGSVNGAAGREGGSSTAGGGHPFWLWIVIGVSIAAAAGVAIGVLVAVRHRAHVRRLNTEHRAALLDELHETGPQ